MEKSLQAVARERLRILGRMGARAVDLDYVQPGRSGGGGRARHLLLLHLDGAEEHIGRRIVLDFMHEFYRALGVDDPYVDADFDSMFAATGEWIATRPLQN